MSVRRQSGNLSIGPLRQERQAVAWRAFPGGFLLGAVMGVLIALLLAPRRGEETPRRTVSMSARKLREGAAGLVRQARADAQPGFVQPRRDVASEPAIERTFGN